MGRNSRDVLYLFLVLIIESSFGILLEDSSLQRLHDLEVKVQQLTSKLQTIEQDTQNQSRSKTIAFMSTLSKDVANPAVGHHVIFDTVMLNEGNAYNNRHGIFTAPVNGTYQFALELSIPPASQNHDIVVHIKKKSQNVAYIYASGQYTHWIKRSASAVVHLDVGDDVYVMVDGFVGSHTIAGAALHSTFSGFLIK